MFILIIIREMLPEKIYNTEKIIKKTFMIMIKEMKFREVD
jgi:hypothetical protein